jgi:curved DNA-binding protein CbpA
MKDYYAILGVVSSAEDVVIRAAYRALTQRYHPDRNSGDPARMAEINEAYSVLSDEEKRKAYDRSRGDKEGDFGDWVHEEEADETSYSFDPLEKDWELAVKYYPDLIEINSRLSKISHLLSFTYRAGLLDLKAFKDRKELAQVVETKFLSTYFGSNPEIVNFARELIINGNKAAAKSLNEAVRVLGSDTPASLIIGTISKEYDIETAEIKKQRLWKEKQERERQENLAKAAKKKAEAEAAQARKREEISAKVGNKATAEEIDLMVSLGITFDGKSFYYKQFKYDKLSDASNYAKKQQNLN